MKFFPYIVDPEILAIPIVECNESLVDLKNYTEMQYGEPPECTLTKDCYTKIRKTVFEKLCQAQQDLPNGWRFRLYEGFRSLEVQQLLFEQEFKRIVQAYPGEDPKQQFYKTTRLISPVNNFDGSQNIPAHNTGAAIDIEVINSEGHLVDMGMAVKDWAAVDPDLCLTDSQLITEKVRQNRQLFHKIMQTHGFINYPTEWWHFSYGDRYWAFYQPVKQAIYGSVEGEGVESKFTA